MTVAEGRVDLPTNIRADGRILHGALFVRPDAGLLLEFDSLRTFVHMAGGLITHAQLFTNNGKLAQSELDRLERAGYSTEIRFPEGT